jgi:hypothetical protein
MVVSATNGYGPRESSAARGPLHWVRKVEDHSPIDDEVIVGRDHERHLLSLLVDSLTLAGGAVVILGEPGMGKTLLMRSVAHYASRQDVSIHILRGIESEAVLPFAAITDLFVAASGTPGDASGDSAGGARGMPGSLWWASPWASSRLCRHPRSSCCRCRSASANCPDR